MVSWWWKKKKIIRWIKQNQKSTRKMNRDSIKILPVTHVALREDRSRVSRHNGRSVVGTARYELYYVYGCDGKIKRKTDHVRRRSGKQKLLTWHATRDSRTKTERAPRGITDGSPRARHRPPTADTHAVVVRINAVTDGHHRYTDSEYGYVITRLPMMWLCVHVVCQRRLFDIRDARPGSHRIYLRVSTTILENEF